MKTLEEQYEDYIEEYNSLMEDRQKLLVEKMDIDDIIRKLNLRIKSLDFKFHRLQQQVVSKGGN